MIDFELLKNPAVEYRGKPFWTWNGKIEKSEVERQVKALKKMGFGGAFAANKAMEMISGGTTTSSTANTPESSEDNSSLSSYAQEVIDSIQAGVTSHTVSGNIEYNRLA